jgi:hypothetical protein
MDDQAHSPCPEPGALAALIDGALDESQRDTLDEHLADCTDCRWVVALNLPISHREHQDDLLEALLVPGSVWDERYEIRGTLGQGASSVVVEAFDSRVRRLVALKVARGVIDAEERARWHAEAEATARIVHPSVVPIYDFGDRAGRPYLAVRRLEGESMRRWLAAAPRSLDELLGAFSVLAEALAAAHARGLVHRDFKPENVIMEGPAHTPVIIDFGLTLLDARPGAIVGTPRYMAPELLAGGTTSAAADQYAFCVTLYEALAGRPPRDGRTLGTLRQQQRVPPPPLPTSVPRWLSRLVLRGLAGEPGARHPSMASIARLLRSHLEPRAVRWPLVVALGAALVLAAGILVTSTPEPVSQVAPVLHARHVYVRPFITAGDGALGFLVREALRAQLSDPPRVRTLRPFNSRDIESGLALPAGPLTAEDARRIGRLTYGAQVVEGTVSQEAGELRASARVVDSRTGAELARVVASGADAEALAVALAATLRAELRLPPRLEPVAGALPLGTAAQARFAQALRSLQLGEDQAFRAAVVELERLDPGFAGGHALSAQFRLFRLDDDAARDFARAKQLPRGLPAEDRAWLESLAEVFAGQVDVGVARCRQHAAVDEQDEALQLDLVSCLLSARFHEEALKVVRRQPSHDGRAPANPLLLGQEAALWRKLNDLPQARTVSARCVAVAREVGERLQAAQCLVHGAAVAQLLGRWEEAGQLAAEGRLLAEAGGWHGVANQAFDIELTIALGTDRLTHAEALVRGRLALPWVAADGDAWRRARLQLVPILADHGRLREARALVDELIDAYVIGLDINNSGYAHLTAARLARLAGDVALAERLVGIGLSMYTAQRNARLEAFGRIVRGEVHLAAGRLDAARADVESAWQVRRSSSLGRQADLSALLLAEIELAEGQVARAEQLLHEVLDRADHGLTSTDVAYGWSLLTLVMIESGRAHEALRLATLARTTGLASESMSLRMELSRTQALAWLAALGPMAVPAVRAQLRPLIAEAEEAGLEVVALELRLVDARAQLVAGRGVQARRLADEIARTAEARGLGLVTRRARALAAP